MRRLLVALAVLAVGGCGFTGTGRPGDADAAKATDATGPSDDGARELDAARAWIVIETMTIDTANSGGVVSATALEAGVAYRLRASGTASVIDGIPGDADYYDFANPKDDACCEDVGIGIDDPLVDLDTTPDWGPYDASHVYVITMTGTGAPFRATYQDTVYGNNSGSLTLEILAFQ